MTMLTTILLTTTLLSPSSRAFSPPPTWEALQSTPSLANRPSPPIYHDDALPESLITDSSLPVLYRDKNCICAACESVWLALEVKNVDYITVLVDKQQHNNGHESNDNEEQQFMLPRIKWPSTSNKDNISSSSSKHEDNNTSDPVKLLEQIQSRYPNTPPQFYPPLSSAVDASRCNILRLPGVMPRNSDTNLMSLAPYLFRTDGTLVKPSSHAVSLEEVEEMQEEYYLGDFLCGRAITAADLIWAPYLERYAVQLPLVYGNKARLNPRNRNVYGEVDNWYRVMEGEEVPAYSCRVMGDDRHWRRCLEVATCIHNERVVDDEERVCLPDGIPTNQNKKNGVVNNNKAGEIWSEYCSQRPWLAPTPGGEVALFMMRNRENIVNAAVIATSSGENFDSNNTADESLRELIQVLLEWDSYFDQSSEEEETAQPLSERGFRMALFVAEEMIEVPRDLGMIPVGVLWEVIRSCD